MVDATPLVCENDTLDPMEECDDGNLEAGDGCLATCQIEGEDTDGDGVPDEDDACPDSILEPTVVIDSRDSQVGNTLLSDSCTISDEIEECAANATKHGAFRRCVSKLGDGLQKDGVLTGAEKEQILSCAGRRQAKVHRVGQSAPDTSPGVRAKSSGKRTTAMAARLPQNLAVVICRASSSYKTEAIAFWAADLHNISR